MFRTATGSKELLNLISKIPLFVEEERAGAVPGGGGKQNLWFVRLPSYCTFYGLRYRSQHPRKLPVFIFFTNHKTYLCVGKG
jgi:hypothetical protein